MFNMEESQHHYYDYMLYLMREYGAEFITFLVLLTNTMLVMIRDRTRKHKEIPRQWFSRTFVICNAIINWDREKGKSKE